MYHGLESCTIHSYPHAFINRKGEPILVTTLHEKQCQPLIEMYLAYRPRNSFQGLPPTTDEACLKWVQHMIGHGVNLVALSFGEGVVGHAVLSPVEELACEMLTVVSSTFQKTGIGTELVRCIVQLSDELGFEEIRLAVEMTNAVARHVYKKCGFEHRSHELHGEVDMAIDLKSYRQTLGVHVGDIMNKDVITARAHEPCQAALTVFLSSPVASLPVVDERGKLEGIITKTDLMVPANVHRQISEVFTRNVVAVQEGCTIAKVIRMLQSKKVRAIPVVDAAGYLVGVVGRREILNYYARHL